MTKVSNENLLLELKHVFHSEGVAGSLIFGPIFFMPVWVCSNCKSWELSFPQGATSQRPGKACKKLIHQTPGAIPITTDLVELVWALWISIAFLKRFNPKAAAGRLTIWPQLQQLWNEPKKLNIPNQTTNWKNYTRHWPQAGLFLSIIVM